jgi:hypothetical protein
MNREKDLGSGIIPFLAAQGFKGASAAGQTHDAKGENLTRILADPL